ncbi:hypothetical protein Tco_1130170 [Tanacetum coccineum]
MIPIPLGVWNFMAPWTVDTTIPICCIAVLPSSKLCSESDFTITNVSVFFTMMGPSPIVISRVISPNGHDCSPEKPIRGVFESTHRDLIDGFSFKKQCLYITSHKLPPSRYTLFTCLPNMYPLIMTGSAEPIFGRDGEAISPILLCASCPDLMASSIWCLNSRHWFVSCPYSLWKWQYLVLSLDQLAPGENRPISFGPMLLPQENFFDLSGSPLRWMEGPWRDAQPNSLFSSHEQSLRFVVLHVNLRFPRCVFVNFFCWLKCDRNLAFRSSVLRMPKPAFMTIPPYAAESLR